MSWVAGVLAAVVILLALNHHYLAAVGIAASAAFIARLKGDAE